MDLSHDSIIAAVKSKDWKLRATMRAIFRRSLYAFTKFVTCFNEPRNLMDVETYKEASDWLQWVITTKKRGSGLGLAIINRIIVDHNGTIQVKDNTPQGTRFVIDLPYSLVSLKTAPRPATKIPT